MPRTNKSQKGKTPDYRVCATYKDKSDKTQYQEIGAAWYFDNDNARGISINLKALPLGDGGIVLFENDQ